MSEYKHLQNSHISRTEITNENFVFGIHGPTPTANCRESPEPRTSFRVKPKATPIHGKLTHTLPNEEKVFGVYVSVTTFLGNR